jgi:hypothetical protein
MPRKPAVRSLACRLLADRREGGAALRHFAADEPPAKARAGLLGLPEHVLCAVEVLGPAAGDERAGLAGAHRPTTVQ